MATNPINSAMTYGQRYKTLGEAIDKINSTDDNTPVDIILIPPEVDVQTDEEDVDEDDLLSTSAPKDVPGEVELAHYSDEEDDNIPLSIFRDMLHRTEQHGPKQKKKNTHIWSDDMEDVEEMEGTYTRESVDELANTFNNSTPVQIFEKLLDNVIIDHIVNQSIIYARQKNDHAFSVTAEDIKIFIGVLLYSGYHKLPRERFYWSLDEDFNTATVYNAISKNRFYEIKKNLHFADNTALDKNDKMAKLRPLMNLLNRNFQQCSKQFLIKKPVRFGYKNWMLCSSCGYCFAYDTYCGAKPNQTEKGNKLPLGFSVVLDLLKVVSTPSSHIVFFDNFFTGLDLMVELRKKGFRATWTVRDNRTKKCPLTPQVIMKKKTW
ncbi:hypothetical protein CBL_02870 [Carabus blaptoides fortunei]